MVKKDNKDNLLIKSSLTTFLNNRGIKRISNDVFEIFNDYFIQELEVLSDKIKQEMIICGKKTFDKDVLKRVLKI